MFVTVCIIWVVFTVGVFIIKHNTDGKENMVQETTEPTQEIVYVTEYQYPKTYYDEVSVSEDDVELLARLVYLEARNQPEVGQRCIIEVVMNRTLDSRFPNTIHNVIYQDEPALQFSTSPYIEDTTPTQEQYNVVNMVLNEMSPILDTSTVYFSTFPQTKNITAIINDHYFCS